MKSCVWKGWIVFYRVWWDYAHCVFVLVRNGGWWNVMCCILHRGSRNSFMNISCQLSYYQFPNDVLLPKDPPLSTTNTTFIILLLLFLIIPLIIYLKSGAKSLVFYFATSWCSYDIVLSNYFKITSVSKKSLNLQILM